MVDLTLVYSMAKAIFTTNPGILALVTGNSNYFSVVEDAITKQWLAETWFWTKGRKLLLY